MVGTMVGGFLGFIRMVGGSLILMVLVLVLELVLVLVLVLMLKCVLVADEGRTARGGKTIIVADAEKGCCVLLAPRVGGRDGGRRRTRLDGGREGGRRGRVVSKLADGSGSAAGRKA
jgi:hypothetical protein